MTLHVADVSDDAPLASLLESDRRWAVFGLCDIDEPYRQLSRFVGAWREGQLDAAILVFAPPGFTALILYGEHAGVEAILQRAKALPAQAVFQARGSDMDALRARFQLDPVFDMYRMEVRSDAVTRESSSYASVRRVSRVDETAAQNLYNLWDGVSFDPTLLETEVYVGAFREGTLVAIAGTHAVSRRRSIGAVGGVLTHPAHRGKGLAGVTTSHVVSELARMGVKDVALNVKADNPAAIRAYERIGFRRVSQFVEGTLRDGRGA